MLPVRAGQQDGADTTYPANVWDTGQRRSHFPGDDGDLRMGVNWSMYRFSDNGDGTVTDKFTELMWLKDFNCMQTRYPDYPRKIS